MKAEPPVKCHLYSRFSPRPDSAESESCISQVRDLREEAAKRRWKVAGEFSDPDCKGDDEDRPAIWQAMAALQKGQVLFVWKSCRLARSVYLSEILHRHAREQGARIEFLHGRNGDSADDVLVRQILAAVDEHTKKANAARTKYAMLSHQKNGRRMSRFAPLGRMIDPNDPKRLIASTEELELIAQIKAAVEHHEGRYCIATKMLRKSGVTFRGKLIERQMVAKAIAYDGPLALPESTEPLPVSVLPEEVQRALMA